MHAPAPCDHDSNVYWTPSSVCVAGADAVCVEPVMNMRVNGVVPVSSSTVRCSPGTLVANVACTVFGCRSTLSVSVRPPESVTVRRSSRWAG
jgi:hypothetical protein